MIVQKLSDGTYRVKDAPDFMQKMQKAKMNYLKKKGLSNYEAKNLKWVDGKLYHNGKNTGFTVNQLMRDASPGKKEIIKERAVITLSLKNKKTGKTAKQVINIVQSPKETGKIDSGRIDRSAKTWVKQEAPHVFHDPMELVSYSVKKMPHKYII